MVVSCCVINCTTRFDKENPCAFFRVPKNPEIRRNQWISAIRRTNPNGGLWTPSAHDRVCYRHFISGKKSNDQSNPDYVPSINMGYAENKDPVLRVARHERTQRREAERDRQEAAAVLMDISENIPPSEETTTAGVHDKCMKTIAELRIENEQLHTELARLQHENGQLTEELQGLQFEDQATSTDKKTLFYTGVPTKALFMWLVSFCTTVLPTSKVMTPSHVLLSILMKLRLNLQFQDIAFRFRVSIQHNSFRPL